MESIKLLLIDDEQSMYDIVTHYCKKNTEYHIELEWYDEVPADIQTISEAPYQLLLLDYHINQHTGIDVLAKLNNEQKISNLPVIMLTNSSDINIAAQAMHYGISDFIPKGNLSAELLNTTINNVLFKHNLKLALIKTNNDLLKKNEEISNFYQVISHELKTPLASMTAFISLMLQGIGGELTNEQKEFLNICQNNCAQLSLYINDLLDVARISTGKYQINKFKTSINTIAFDAIKTSQILANGKKIQLKYECNEPEICLAVDKARIYQALLILINNAIKFSPENDEIKIILFNDNNTQTLSISVIDNGCGISKEDHEKIFERLYQTHAKDKNNPGLGLGLFICQEIVGLHDGTILVESEPNKGSTFTIKLRNSI